MAGQPNTLRERRLLAEYLAATFPHDRVMQEVRLGGPPPAPYGFGDDNSTRAYLGNRRRYADALVIRATDVILIEAKVEADPGIVSTLQLYGKLMPLTPELREFKDRRLRMMLLWAIDDPVLATIAKQAGIEVVVWCPQWVKDDLRAKYANKLRMTTPSWTDPGVLA